MKNIFLRKVKIGNIRELYINNKRILTYKYDNDKKIRELTLFPKEEKINTDKPVFYLKINAVTDYTFSNLSHWIKIAEAYQADYYIICDNNSLNRALLKQNIYQYPNIKIIKSCKDKYMKNLLAKIGGKQWGRAAYAHITTFYHASKNNIKRFYNIDADDTTILLEPERAVEFLKKVEEYAHSNNINVFSLDMHQSKCNGKSWTLGVAYVQNENNWLDIFNETKDRSWPYYDNREVTDGSYSADGYIFYLAAKAKQINVGSFYCDNLYFMHWKYVSGFKLYCWQSGKLKFPLLCSFHDLNDINSLDLSDKCSKINFDIDEKESLEIVFKKVFNVNALRKYIYMFKDDNYGKQGKE